MDEKVTQYLADVKNDFKNIIKVMSMLLIGSLLINVVIAGIFLFDARNQRQEFMSTINKQQTEFIDFLAQYDFSVEEYSQDGEGVNYMNKDVQGDIRNGSENKNKKDDSERQEIESNYTNN